MRKINSFLKEEFVNGRTTFDVLFLLFGLLLQIVTFTITDNSVLSLVSGLSGVLSVVLCSQRKISFYFLGFIQLFTYVILSWKEAFYGELIENAFYFVTMIYGIYIWLKHYRTNEKDENEVVTKSLTHKGLTFSLAIGFFGTLFTWQAFKYTNDTQPFIDSITTVPALIAQVLSIYRYKESWHYWLFIDFGSIILWVNAENYCMAMQYVFWSLNCLYGLKKWTNVNKL